jgi:fructose/tagatose bisphosphate aldolase
MPNYFTICESSPFLYRSAIFSSDIGLIFAAWPSHPNARKRALQTFIAGEAFLRHLISAAVEAYPHIPVVMHQDHGQSPAVCMAAIKSGFTSVMMDGSLMEDGKSVASYEYNMEVSREVVKFSVRSKP